MKLTYKVLGYSVTSESVDNIVRESLTNEALQIVNTINPHSYVTSKNDSDFRDALQESDVLIPDGSGIVFAVSQVYKEKISKIAGFDLFTETMSQLNQLNGKVFFLGSTELVLDEINKRVSSDYPNVTVEVLSPPYKQEFTTEDIEGFKAAISEFGPDVIFVGLTAPKQEKLIALMKNSIDAKMISGVGAVFDFYAGTVKRPNKIWLDLHLEWLIRLLGEPKRLWKRNFISTPIFIFDVLMQKMRTGKKS